MKIINSKSLLVASIVNNRVHFEKKESIEGSNNFFTKKQISNILDVHEGDVNFPESEFIDTDGDLSVDGEFTANVAKDLVEYLDEILIDSARRGSAEYEAVENFVTTFNS